MSNCKRPLSYHDCSIGKEAAFPDTVTSCWVEGYLSVTFSLLLLISLEPSKV